MKAEQINPFIQALTTTFETMLGCSVTRGQASLGESQPKLYEVSGTIGLSGSAAGLVLLSLSKELALKAASTMLMEEIPEINPDVLDSVGELTNMVAGSAKAKLEQEQLSVSLPSIITGTNHSVTFPSKCTPIFVPFTTEWGPFSLQVGLEPT